MAYWSHKKHQIDHRSSSFKFLSIFDLFTAPVDIHHIPSVGEVTFVICLEQGFCWAISKMEYCDNSTRLRNLPRTYHLNSKHFIKDFDIQNHEYKAEFLL